jgi:hypothetical protein
MPAFPVKVGEALGPAVSESCPMESRALAAVAVVVVTAPSARVSCSAGRPPESTGSSPS